MDVIGGHHAKWLARIRNTKDTFSLRSKDKHIHKNKLNHIQTQMLNMFVTIELLHELGERGKGKESDSVLIISHTIVYKC
jgi:hypothetical protein